RLVQGLFVILIATLLSVGTVASALAADAPGPAAPQSNPPAAAQGSPGPSAGPPSSGGGISFPDPKQWAIEVFSQVIVTTLQSLESGLHGLLDGVLNSQMNVITQTPPSATYASTTVHDVWDKLRLVANAALALVAVWGGFNVMVKEQLGAPYHDALELLPRLALGALLVNTSLSWGQLAIDTNNVLCQVVGQVSLPGWDQAGGASQLYVDIIATLLYLVAGIVLLIQMLIRVALVDVLLAVAPIALVCWVLPQTQRWANQWSSIFFGTVFVQLLQVTAIKLGGGTLKDMGPMHLDKAL
ncbi:MAG: type IV secretion system protein, partial [Chloroflexota bacterium]|nr:type IV secretion system protein [Chloroflexota bacterium]